ncbi:MAG: Caspase domain-containing protein [Elainella sp. Prado103]|nr:Caspase domain-containing protein [Elainella sp. Prado103]
MANRVLLRGWMGVWIGSLLLSHTPVAASAVPCQFNPASNPTLVRSSSSPAHQAERTPTNQTNFLVMGGGGAPAYNEIALEKNMLYFQRTLQTLGFNPAAASLFFANGMDGTATVRYLQQGKELFKVPEIPHLAGAATLSNFQAWMQQTQQQADRRPIFFYFTGHGYRNPANLNNNAMILWGEDLLSVQQLTRSLDLLPPEQPVVTMMAQCYSGSFANLIYAAGDPRNPVALHTRCGFFATIKSRPSVGCTPEVNEADYRDYSSSFFAGLSGRDRAGQTVASADYNRDGQVSYAEAHAFAKVDEQSTDLPVSTLEVWLQEQASRQRSQFLNQPIASLMSTARPEQQHVVRSLTRQFELDINQSFHQNTNQLRPRSLTADQQAWMTRLGMELVNIGMEKHLRDRGDPSVIPILERLIRCEAGSWSRAERNPV